MSETELVPHKKVIKPKETVLFFFTLLKKKNIAIMTATFKKQIHF